VREAGLGKSGLLEWEDSTKPRSAIAGMKFVDGLPASLELNHRIRQRGHSEWTKKTPSRGDSSSVSVRATHLEDDARF
jgi:hypothetical protein